MKEMKMLVLVAILVCLIVFIVFGMTRYNQRDLFFERIQKIDFVYVMKYPMSYILTKEELTKFKTILIKHYETSNFKREKFMGDYPPLVFRVQSGNLKFLVGYYEENRELLFTALWFIKGRDEKTGEKIYYTDDLMLSVSEDIEIFLNEIGFDKYQK